MILKPRCLNASPDKLSRIETSDEPTNLEEGLPNTQLFVFNVVDDQFPYII